MLTLDTRIGAAMEAPSTTTEAEVATPPDAVDCEVTLLRLTLIDTRWATTGSLPKFVAGVSAANSATSDAAKAPALPVASTLLPPPMAIRQSEIDAVIGAVRFDCSSRMLAAVASCPDANRDVADRTEFHKEMVI